jgi:hypothetical protein
VLPHRDIHRYRAQPTISGILQARVDTSEAAVEAGGKKPAHRTLCTTNEVYMSCEEMIRLLTEEKSAIKVFVEVNGGR